MIHLLFGRVIKANNHWRYGNPGHILSVTQIFIIALSSSLSGLLYSLGGLAKQGKWYDFACNTKTRDVGVSLVTSIVTGLLFGWHWSLVLCFGALFGALTTYNKWVSYLFNRPDKHTVYWESWFVTGLFYGLSLLPYVVFSGDWLLFFIRCIVLATTTCLWSQLIGKAWLEEFGRGFLIVATLSILLI